jgi:POT family proton-dependent oligopeptide transporter
MLDATRPPRPPRASTAHELWLGHPRGLAILFGAELWERFSYYGMRALLVLYVIEALGRSEPEAYALYAVYGAVVYAFGVLGGTLAQRSIGELRAIVLGGSLMAAGHLVMALPWAEGLYLALALLCVGNGLFKPNVSSRVGDLYEEGDRRKAQGFYLFYMGINIGATLAPIVCSTVAARLGWHYGFGLAGVGMGLGLAIVVRGRSLLRSRRDPAAAAHREAPLSARGALGLALAVVAMVLLATMLLWKHALGELAIELTTLAVLVVMAVMVVRLRGPARRKLLALVVLMAFHAAFWAAFEQIGSSLTVLSEQHVDRTVLGLRIPAPALLALNGALVIALAPVIAWAFARLARCGLEPSTPAKFGLGLVLLGAAFLALTLGLERGAVAGEVALAWVVLFYVLLTVGELCLSPVGLAMVGELAPRGATSFCMGAWFLTYANGHLLAGIIAGSTARTGTAAETVAEALARYAEVFARVGLGTLALGLVLLALRRVVQRLVAGEGS